MATNKIFNLPVLNTSKDNLNAAPGTASSTRFNDAIEGLTGVYEYLNTIKPVDGQSFNLRIVPTVTTGTSGGLTVALRAESSNGGVPSAMDTNDPDATGGDPVFIAVGGKLVQITSDIKLFLQNGSNWFNASGAACNGQIINLFVYALYNKTTGAIGLGLARVPFFKSGTEKPGTVTEPDYWAFTSGFSDDAMVVIGRIRAKLTGNTWQSDFTQDVVHGPTVFSEKLLANYSFTNFNKQGSITTYNYSIVNDRCNIDWVTTFGNATSTSADTSCKLPFKSRNNMWNFFGNSIYAFSGGSANNTFQMASAQVRNGDDNFYFFWDLNTNRFPATSGLYEVCNGWTTYVPLSS